MRCSPLRRGRTRRCRFLGHRGYARNVDASSQMETSCPGRQHHRQRRLGPGPPGKEKAPRLGRVEAPRAILPHPGPSYAQLAPRDGCEAASSLSPIPPHPGIPGMGTVQLGCIWWDAGTVQLRSGSYTLSIPAGGSHHPPRAEVPLPTPRPAQDQVRGDQPQSRPHHSPVHKSWHGLGECRWFNWFPVGDVSLQQELGQSNWLKSC